MQAAARFAIRRAIQDALYCLPTGNKRHYLRPVMLRSRKALRRHDLAVTAAEFFDLSEHEAHADARDGLTHRQPVQASHAAIRP